MYLRLTNRQQYSPIDYNFEKVSIDLGAKHTVARRAAINGIYYMTYYHMHTSIVICVDLEIMLWHELSLVSRYIQAIST